MKEKTPIRKTLYRKKVERLIKRKADIEEIGAIDSAFSQHRAALETANRLISSSDRVDRENDLA